MGINDEKLSYYMLVEVLFFNVVLNKYILLPFANKRENLMCYCFIKLNNNYIYCGFEMICKIS